MPKRARVHISLAAPQDVSEPNRCNRISRRLSFLDLPREIRDMIYDYAIPAATYFDRQKLVDEGQIPHDVLPRPAYMYPVVTDVGLGKHTIPSLFLVSRKISEEAMCVHHSKGLICLDSGLRDRTKQDGYIRWKDELVVTNPRSFRGKTWPRYASARRAWKLGLAITRFKNIIFVKQDAYDPLRFLDQIRETLKIIASVNPDLARRQIISAHLTNMQNPYNDYPLPFFFYLNSPSDYNNRIKCFWKSLHDLVATSQISRKFGITGQRSYSVWNRGWITSLNLPPQYVNMELVDSYGFELVATLPSSETSGGYFWPQAGDVFRESICS